MYLSFKNYASDIDDSMGFVFESKFFFKFNLKYFYSVSVQGQ